MGLLDDLKNLDQFGTPQGPRCTVCRLLNRLDAKEADALEAVLADENISTTALSRALAANDHRIAAGTLRRHQKGECRGTQR